MTREELITSPEYWITSAQIELYERALDFMKETGKNRKELAEHLGVTKSYVTQLLNGDFDHRLSKFVELSLAFGYVPKIDLIPKDEFVAWDYNHDAPWSVKKFSEPIACQSIVVKNSNVYGRIDDSFIDENAA